MASGKSTTRRRLIKRVYVTQRVEVIPEYGERRDALDQRWGDFLLETGALAFPVPNSPRLVLEMLKTVRPDGILLTGGNSPAAYGGEAPERDEVDGLLINHAMALGIPLVGVCRGMQSIVLHFGGSLKVVEGHVARRHEVGGLINRTVNSYHNLGVDTVPSCLEVAARARDGNPEAVRHASLPVFAVMWHPERESGFAKEDIDVFSMIWNGRMDFL